MSLRGFEVPELMATSEPAPGGEAHAPPRTEPSGTALPAATAAQAARLAAALRFRTVSPEGPAEVDRRPFLELHAFLHRAFPRVHATLRRETVGGLSLLYTWRGTHPEVPPILLSSHLDVVPAPDEGPSPWAHPPFGGDIADGRVWGRGALDDKCAVVGTLEAVEQLLAEGVSPRRTILLALGHDEERGGLEGAAHIAALLRDRGVHLEYVIDEGLVIADGLLPGVRRPVALIGTAEKGQMVLELSARSAPGHPAMPPRQSVIGILGRAVARLEAHPMPVRLREPTRSLLEHLAPEMPRVRRIACAHPGLFGTLVARGLARSATTNAAVRTTMAVMTAAAGTKDNVLPDAARATVDVRILPGDRSEDVLAHVRRVVADDAVHVRPLHVVEPSPVAPLDGVGFQILAGTVRAVFPEAAVAPGLVIAGTDSRHYAPLSDAIYRFRPVRLGAEDVGRIHGVDERIAVEDYARLVTFYARFLHAASWGGVTEAGRETLPAA